MEKVETHNIIEKGRGGGGEAFSVNKHACNKKKALQEGKQTENRRGPGGGKKLGEKKEKKKNPRSPCARSKGRLANLKKKESK